MIKRIKEYVNSLNQRQVVALVVVFCIAAIVFVGMTFFKDAFQQIGLTILLVELAILVTVAWALAGHAVMKSLFVVGASLTLIIFLAQAYCEVPNLTQSGNDALKTLIAFGLLYIGFNFFRALYKEVTERTKTLKEISKGESPWVFLIPFALFVGIFLWQVSQVVYPIIQNLCIYQ
ncbi:MAG TPA: hypothetical protein VNM40_02100 [Candidatus Paceibacterota bacterium]|nr:hypothetical protein [Candidatus Paceibacterota bacterium]